MRKSRRNPPSHYKRAMKNWTFLETLLKGRRKHGHMFELPTGDCFYMALRKFPEIYKNGARTVLEAVEVGTGSFMMDPEMIFRLRSYGKPVKFVGMWCRDTDDLFVSKFEDWHNGNQITRHAHYGAQEPLTHLELRYFKHSRAEYVA